MFWKIASAHGQCDSKLLDVPKNGKSWNYNEIKRRWELECEKNYEVERGFFQFKNSFIQRN